MIAYFNGQFLPKEEIRISPDDRGFLFADGVCEVIRAYGGKPFKMAEHLQHLARSLREIRIDYPALPELAAIGEKLIAANQLAVGEYATLYIQITRGAPASRKHPFPDEPVLHYGGMIVSKERCRVASCCCLSPLKPARFGLLPLRRGPF